MTTEKKVMKELLRFQEQLKSGKKKIRIPWYLVPREILLDVAKSTGFDPTKQKWIVTIKEGKRHYGVAA